MVGGIGGPLITQRDVRFDRRFPEFTPVIQAATNKTPQGSARRESSRIFGTPFDELHSTEEKAQRLKAAKQRIIDQSLRQ